MRDPVIPKGTLIVAEKDKVAKALANILLVKYKIAKYRGIPIYTAGNTWIFGVRGHILELDFAEYKKWTLDSIEKLFNAKVRYYVREGMKRYVEAIKRYATMAYRLYLALDNDVEGEHIAWEVLSIARRANPHIMVYRVRFSSLDPEEIVNAFRNPDTINWNWVEKSATRQEVDLRTGVIFTRLLTLSTRRHLRRDKMKKLLISYGPCQTPTLRLIVEPYLKWERGEKYRYRLKVEMLHPLYGEFAISKTYKKLEEANKIKDEILRIKYAKVIDFKLWHEKKNPPVPLDAYDYASRVSRFLKIPSREAMSIAEELYRRGLISYPRTETQRYRGVDIRKVLQRLRHYYDRDINVVISKLLSKDKIIPREGSGDDKAHPPIYPIRGARRGELRSDKERMVYDFIVRHFLATLMPPAILEKSKAVIKIGSLTAELHGVRITKKGYLEVYHYEIPKEKDIPLRKGDVLKVIRVSISKEKVKPEYLSESELIKIMKIKGIGTDSTMHEHIHKNIVRKYAIRKGGRLIPTPLGIDLIKTLIHLTPELADVDLRSKMEKAFSQVAEGTKKKKDVIADILSTYREAYRKVIERIGEISKILATHIGKR